VTDSLFAGLISCSRLLDGEGESVEAEVLRRSDPRLVDRADKAETADALRTGDSKCTACEVGIALSGSELPTSKPELQTVGKGDGTRNTCEVICLAEATASLSVDLRLSGSLLPDREVEEIVEGLGRGDGERRRICETIFFVAGKLPNDAEGLSGTSCWAILLSLAALRLGINAARLANK